MAAWFQSHEEEEEEEEEEWNLAIGKRPPWKMKHIIHSKSRFGGRSGAQFN